MRSAIAPDPREVHGIFDAAHAPLLDVVAGLVGALGHAKTLAAILEHFGHERHGVQLAVLVEGGKNLLAAADFHQFVGEKVEALRGIALCHLRFHLFLCTPYGADFGAPKLRKRDWAVAWMAISSLAYSKLADTFTEAAPRPIEGGRAAKQPPATIASFLLRCLRGATTS